VKLVLVFAGLLVLYLVLDRSAWALQSFRGEWGLVVGALTVAASVLIEWAVSRRGPWDASIALGLGRSRPAALWFALVAGGLLVAVIPAYCAAMALPLSLHEGWWWLAIGIFAQGGLAEETVFRGFLFRHVRRGRTFWRAAVIAAVPFVLVHLAIFWTMEPIVAAVSVAVALSLTFPLAAIYERAENSIWPGAILHAVIQGAIKLVVVPSDSFTELALVWLVVTAIVPWAIFLWPKTESGTVAQATPNRAHRGSSARGEREQI
jgi:membrane protease YdiL (CAAX protease family)